MSPGETSASEGKQALATVLPPCVQYEDSHLLVVRKPAGWNTHAPSPYAGEGIYDWLHHREPRWATLAILHRLDKETSGLLVFGKTPEANRSLTQQFTDRSVLKQYTLWVSRRPDREAWTIESVLIRTGDRYTSRPSAASGERAETHFRVVGPIEGGHWELEAEPRTGRTHQIRVHAAEAGCPIVGDLLYGGVKFSRVCLHATQLEFAHPEDGRRVRFESVADFLSEPRIQLRSAFISPSETDAFRLRHGAPDGTPQTYVDQVGPFTLVQQPSAETIPPNLAGGVYRKILRRDVRQSTLEETSPQHVTGLTAPDRFFIRENGLKYELSFREGYSVGLFLDQRDNRRRLLVNQIAAGFPLRPRALDLTGTEVLNAFAYTCGFSLCAAVAGARTTSLDLSRKYLDWGRRNFVHNHLDPAAHDFIYGDCFDWIKRLAKKGRVFDIVVLDPPTFSRSKEWGDFRADQDYGRLVTSVMPLLKADGVLLASTNAARFEPELFLAQVREAIRQTGRRIGQEHYVPQPPDFPISRAESAYLKTVWVRIVK